METTTTVAVAPPILYSARAAVMILTAAQSGDVPLPDQVEHIMLGGDEVNLVFYVATIDDLSAWATWLEAPITVADDVMPSGRVHCSVDGQLFDHPLRVICMNEVPV
jgi:hypothetical protein